MNKENTSKLLKKVDKKPLALQAINELPVSEVQNTINREVFGIITRDEKELLKKFIKNKPLEKNKRIEAKKLVIDLLRFYASLNNKAKSIEDFEYQKEINRIFKTSGIALEFYLLDYLSRNSAATGEFMKGPSYLDPHKVDFMYKQDNIKYGIQLTSTRSPRVNNKRKDMRYLRHAIDNDGDFIPSNNTYDSIDFYMNNKLNKEKISPKFIPDLGVLVIINSDLNNKKKKKKNVKVFTKAFKSWKENGYSSEGPSAHLPDNLKKDFDYISETYPLVMKEFLQIIKTKNGISIPYSFRKFLPNGTGELFINIDSEGKIINFECFADELDKSDFLYSVSFYITDKFLTKINENNAN